MARFSAIRQDGAHARLSASSGKAAADLPVENDYDSYAEGYTAETENNLINGYYARPAIIALAGDVAGRQILDAGCGSGPIFAALRDRGAIVTGFDASAKMVELARRRLGADAALHVADIAGPLPFPDGASDDAIASLVLHYLKDWTAPLAELRRVLKPGGRLIVAINHPFVFKLGHPDADYFATVKHSEEYTFDGQKAVLTYWHRPLHAMTDAFTAAGFCTAVVSEPPPAPEARELFADVVPRASSGRFPSYLFFVLEATNEPCVARSVSA
ncbi:class I SAM-dependent methyltransferase [Nocardia cyriacigeorgica]|uniref:class I SAM-dependent methyltransferase n=1 Tax=Nocardia cyriacigeorgica TaxID=135487 RepID=UPI001894B10F|nr:class I SAM-dependent methyltransferase [Nocardia cyriacigeorgica]MBF6290026.1 class I SAM-dependent methyltransferase [Nocardia cyriacigeorgica]